MIELVKITFVDAKSFLGPDTWIIFICEDSVALVSMGSA
jgi:hypothetical protein